jgi:glucosamine--fructose-6-phosphate aminotransferase (isomerizing)
MLLLAIQLGSVQGRGRVAVSAPAAQLRSELVDLADLVEATATEAGRRCVALAERIASSPVMVVIGSGPSQGTAMFAAAKIIEACGIFATGKDLEEWSHVERFAYPLDMPVFVIAPPGRTHQRAAEAAAQARSLGRTVIAVTDEDDTVVTAHADCVLPVAGRTREEFSPLLYHAFAAHLGCRLAQRLGRSPFQAGI